MKTTSRFFRALRLFCALPLAALALAAGAPSLVAADPTDKERAFLATLAGESPAADKALACKNLAVHGTEASVPELAKLLSDPQLASWARIALEAIPGPAADAALRQGAEKLQGELLIGAINSLGVRRDSAAQEVLAKRLADSDAEVASAAAVALGHVGDAAAVKTLRGALASAPPKVRSAVAEGCVLCAERLLAAGQADEAAALYDEVRKAEVPKTRRLEAVRGAILARQETGLDLLVEQLRSDDKQFFQLALGVSREIPSRKVDAALAAELGRASADRAPLILLTMADRRETIVLDAVVQAARSGAKELRIAAFASLGKVGDATCLDVLLAGAAGADEDVVRAARAALAELPDPKANEALVARVAKADAKSLAVLLATIGERRIDATATVLKSVDHADGAVRAAALAALGNTISAKQLSVLVAAATKPKHADDAAPALAALKAACIRMPDRDACAAELAKAVESGSTSVKTDLLPIVAAVGGGKALTVVAAAAKHSDDKVQDASSRLLGEWSTIDAAPVLLDLAKSAPSDKYRTRAFRGYVRIARQFVMPEPQRLEMIRNILDRAAGATDQRLVLDILKRYPSVEMLKVSVQLARVPDLKDEATQTSVAIAQKLGGKGAEVLEALTKSGLAKVQLEIVKAEYGAGSTRKDVTATVRKFAGDTQFVAVSATFNEAFGGDPAPGTMKQLTIQYRINGKAGEATFAENAIVILPMPK